MGFLTLPLGGTLGIANVGKFGVPKAGALSRKKKMIAEDYYQKFKNMNKKGQELGGTPLKNLTQLFESMKRAAVKNERYFYCESCRFKEEWRAYYYYFKDKSILRLTEKWWADDMAGVSRYKDEAAMDKVMMLGILAGEMATKCVHLNEAACGIMPDGKVFDFVNFKTYNNWEDYIKHMFKIKNA